MTTSPLVGEDLRYNVAMSIRHWLPRVKSWGKVFEIAVWGVLAAVLLYRCVLPRPSAPLGPQLVATRFATAGTPMVVEFSSSL